MRDMADSRNYERNSFKRMMRTFPKNKAIARIIEDVTADEKAIEALQNAVKRGNVNLVRKLYRPDFFFELLKNARAANATMMNAIVPTRTPPETLIRRQQCRVFFFLLVRPDPFEHGMPGSS
jgi:hypothetical protein